MRTFYATSLKIVKIFIKIPRKFVTEVYNTQKAVSHTPLLHDYKQQALLTYIQKAMSYTPNASVILRIFTSCKHLEAENERRVSLLSKIWREAASVTLQRCIAISLLFCSAEKYTQMSHVFTCILHNNSIYMTFFNYKFCWKTNFDYIPTFLHYVYYLYWRCLGIVKSPDP